MDTIFVEFIRNAKLHGQCQKEGDYKKGNEAHDEIYKTFNLIKEKGLLVDFQKLLKDKNYSVKLWVATLLLKHYEKEALRTLKDIANEGVPFFSFDAKMTISEWENGNLKK